MRPAQGYQACAALPVCSGPPQEGRKEWDRLTDPMEPVTGIGPALPAWKAGALPLSYTDVIGAVKAQAPLF